MSNRIKHSEVRGAFKTLAQMCGKEDDWHLDFQAIYGGWVVMDSNNSKIGSRMESKAFIKSIWFACKILENMHHNNKFPEFTWQLSDLEELADANLLP